MKQKRGNRLADSLPNQLDVLFRAYKKRYSLEEAATKSLQEIQKQLIEGVQKVYLSQGVTISDKHIEIVGRSMTSKG